MNSTLRFLSIVAFAVALSGCGDLNSPLVDKHTAKDRRGQAHERWDNVRGEVKLRLARQHLDAGRLEDAEKVLEQAAAVTPKEPQVFVLLARLRLEQGRLAEARQAMTNARSLNGDDAEIHYLAGIIAERYGESDVAVDCYQLALTRTPNNANYVLALGESYVALGRDIDALELIESRINDFDSNASIQMLAARICRIIGLRNTAVAHAREALRVTPDDQFVIADSAEILLWAERYQDVVTLLQPSIDRASRIIVAPAKGAPPAPFIVTTAVRRCLASAYLSLAKPADAMRTLDPALLQSDVDDATRMLYARAALDAGDFAEADDAIRPLRESRSCAMEVLLLSSAIALESGDACAALNFATSALAKDENSADAQALLMACKRAGQLKMKTEQSAISTNPVSCLTIEGAVPVENTSIKISDERWRP